MAKTTGGYQRAWLCGPPRAKALLYPILRRLSSTSQAAQGVMCVVLDTNMLVSAILSPRGTLAQIRNTWCAEQLSLVI
jgi:hypothetical protein